MNFSDLEIFKAVVDEGGIIKASRRLHRVPSSVTSRIQQLESSMGVSLFHRDRQRLHLSPTGELLRGYADRLIQLSEEARSVVSGAKPQGLLRLGTLESTAASRLPQLLTDFHRLYPDVRLELSTGTNDLLMQALADRRLDAAFTAEAPTQSLVQSLANVPVFRERLVVVSGLDHPPIRRAGDVKDASLIAFPDGCAYRRVLQRWLGVDSLAGKRTLELASYHAIVACVASGTGIALVPESVLDTMPQAHVQRHALPRALADIRTPLVWRDGEISPPVLALRTLVASLQNSKTAALKRKSISSR
jgi:DNA-binding transcriptional LysR family regulator